MIEKDIQLQSNFTHTIYWPKGFTQRAMLFTLLIVVGFYLAFFPYRMPPLLGVLGISIVFLFFGGLTHYTRDWQELPMQTFYRKLFIHSFIYRLIFVGLLYGLTYIFDPSNFPFEINAADSWVYHLVGSALRGNILNGRAIAILSNPAIAYHYASSRADWGYSFYTGIIYSLFGVHTLPVRLLNCLWGSLTVVMLAKIAKMLFSDNHARLVGILSMLMPPLLYYTGVQLKETLMIFLVVTIFYDAVKIVELKKLGFKDIIIMISFTYFLFYFRTFLALLVIFSVIFYLLFNLTIKKERRAVIFTSLIIFSIGIYFLAQRYQFIEPAKRLYYTRTHQGLAFLNWQIKMVGNINVKSTVMFPLIIATAFIAPFPSFLNLDSRQIPHIVVFPNELVRNLLWYFAILGLIYAFRKDFRKNSLLVIFVIGYISALAGSAAAHFPRYQLVALPFMTIFMTVGYIDSSSLWKRRWDKYLLLIFLIEVVWNLFKMKIRGLL